ncbi:GreA/GreB family elongation factor [Motiliproteus sp. MSK22-1]|uniref:GreA/GreB family elongation factor n=1 Tax=Motiliproteus sp. MSK22-1 TaxID=1897630 RepID=UPI000977B4C0|nr:GreA/GreB family elongation factor [Motiliproteus sp. MSK22-1]OMH39768.1 hypothetical protein BGP75_01565 [Motiliproteus sp. MSK22-1]
MDSLITLILDHIEQELSTLLTAAQSAHDGATHEENKAENKYDTRGLEAAYLAHGLSVRAEELQQSIIDYRQLQRLDIDKYSCVQVGTLVCLEDDDGNKRRVFVGPSGGGIKLHFGEDEVTVVTPTSPVGGALLGKVIDDVFTLKVKGLDVNYTIIHMQ